MNLPVLPPGYDWAITTDWDRTTVNLVSMDNKGMSQGVVESYTLKHRDIPREGEPYQGRQNRPVTESEWRKAVADAAAMVWQRVLNRIMYSQWADKMMREE